jgi:hypothetical protein
MHDPKPAQRETAPGRWVAWKKTRKIRNPEKKNRKRKRLSHQSFKREIKNEIRKKN